MQFLEEVLSRCCDTYSYKMSQFEMIYRGMEQESKTQEDLFDEPFFGVQYKTVTMPNGVEVQVRPSDSYRGVFERKVQETAGGSV